MLKIEKETRKNHDGKSYEVLKGTYEARALGGPFRDFEIEEKPFDVCVKLMRCYAEDASWADKTNVQLTVGLLAELAEKFPQKDILVETKIGEIEIPADSSGFEIQEIILNYVIKNSEL